MDKYKLELTSDEISMLSDVILEKSTSCNNLSMVQILHGIIHKMLLSVHKGLMKADDSK